VLRLAASLADGIPADLRDAFTGMDTANVDRAAWRCSTPRDADPEDTEHPGHQGLTGNDYLTMDRRSAGNADLWRAAKLLPYAGQFVAERDRPTRVGQATGASRSPTCSRSCCMLRA
jgi:hypothetical protein